MSASIVLQQNVIDELAWDPIVHGSPIRVTTTRDGVVTLEGRVGSYFIRASAERAARRVRGVSAVANELIVNPPYERDDAEITKDVLAGLSLTVVVPTEHINVSVDHGWVTLDGEVKWQFQKRAAEASIWQVPGVQALRNRIKVKSGPSKARVKEQIEAALERNARLDAQAITVETNDHTVTLRGTVNSIAEREEAEQAAWFAPGVEDVQNLLEVGVLAHGGV